MQQSIKDTWFLFSTRSLFVLRVEFKCEAGKGERGGRCVLNIMCGSIITYFFPSSSIEFRESFKSNNKKILQKNNFLRLFLIALSNMSARCLCILLLLFQGSMKSNSIEIDNEYAYIVMSHVRASLLITLSSVTLQMKSCSMRLK